MARFGPIDLETIMTPRILIASVISILSWVSVALAQDIIPDHRYVYSRDVDFYGADLTPLFDTTQSACTRACDADDACDPSCKKQRDLVAAIA